MALGKEANGGNLGKSSRSSTQYYNCMFSELICRDSKNEFELNMVIEPSVFELLRFDCIWFFWRCRLKVSC